MPKLDAEKLLESVAQALDTTAFISVEPLDETNAMPVADAIEITLPFTGSFNGEAHLVASRTLGGIIASNILADGAAESFERSADALGELANIITGLYLRQICDPADVPELCIPSVSTTPGAVAKDACVASLAAEGHPLTFSVEVHG